MAAPLTLATAPGGVPEDETAHRGLAQAPTALQRFIDKAFFNLCRGFAWLAGLLVAWIIGEMAVRAIPAIREHGTGFLVGTTWDPNLAQYSILPEIWGTLYSSIAALIIGTAFGVAAAIFLSEGFLAMGVVRVLRAFKLEFRPAFQQLPERVEQGLRNLIELLAAIPSVVYGLWGIFVVIPVIRPVCAWLNEELGWVAFFSTPLSGPGMAPAVLVLSIMLLPTITALSRDALTSVPSKLRMAAYGMGATRWETILAVSVPTAARGIFGAVVIAFGRALGETMALAMLVGNANRISLSLFSPANTLAALLANSFPEAGPKEVSVLMYAALVLLAITLVVNIFGSILLMRASRGQEEHR